MLEKINTCYYSPGTDKHTCCTHQHYCIFNPNRTELERQITSLENEITNFKKIKNAAINGEVIYHEELDPYYNISIDSYTGTDGKIHYRTDVKITDKFLNAINIKLDNLRYDLKGLLQFRLDVLHGRIDGYGCE